MIATSILEKDFSHSRTNLLDGVQNLLANSSSQGYATALKIQNAHMELVSWGKLCQDKISEDGTYAQVYAENLLEMICSVDEILLESIKEITK